MENYNLFKCIEQIVSDGWVILQICGLNESDVFFVVNKFEESYFNSAESVDYNLLEGINITEFLYKNVNLYRNKIELMNNLQNYIDDNIVMRVEFSKNVKWCKYASV
jgi:hypothetical protein